MRFFLYPLLTLLGVLLTATTWVLVWDLGPILESTGLSLKQWLLLDLAWTLGSGLFCWVMSRDISIWSTSTQTLDEQQEPDLQRLWKEAAQRLAWTGDIQLGIYPSQEINIFSAGNRPSRSLVSVSRGFLKLSEEQQIELFMHELLKIRNGSTSLLSFCQGMTYGLNLYFARILALLLGTSFLSSEGETSSSNPERIVNFITTLCLTLFGSLVVFQLSRQRQTDADREFLALVGKMPATQYLDKLDAYGKTLEQNDVFTSTLKAAAREQRWKGPFMSHPWMQTRRAKLAQA